jgi:hypothetical protein
MLQLERVQYRGIKIAVGLMCSTPNNSLGVLSGIAPLAERFVYLNIRYLEAVFCRLDHPLKRKLETLGELNSGRCIAGYSDVLPLNVVPSESFTRHERHTLIIWQKLLCQLIIFVNIIHFFRTIFEELKQLQTSTD